MRSRLLDWISRSILPFLSASRAPRLPSLPEDADQIRQLEHGRFGADGCPVHETAWRHPGRLGF
jgi:hypothetical protein